MNRAGLAFSLLFVAGCTTDNGGIVPEGPDIAMSVRPSSRKPPNPTPDPSSRRAISFQVVVSNAASQPSSLETINRLPSGLKTVDLICPSWSKAWTSSPVATSQTPTYPSSPSTSATRLESGVHETALR